MGRTKDERLRKRYETEKPECCRERGMPPLRLDDYPMRELRKAEEEEN